MHQYINLISKEKIQNKFGIYLLLITPFFFLTSSFFLNFHIIISSLFFLIFLSFNRHIFQKFLKIIEFQLLIIFWFLLLISLFYHNNFEISLLRTIGFIRFIFFSIFVFFFIRFSNYKYLNFYLKVWSILFIIITIDVFFEFIFGYNLLGNKSYYPGRISSFTGDELVIGSIYFTLLLIFTSYLFIKKNLYKKKSYFLFLIIIIIITCSFIIGERANFLRSVFCITLFIFFLIKFNFFKYSFKKLFFSFLVCLIIFITISINSRGNIFVTRFYIEFLKPLYLNPIQFYKDSHHGSHYNTAIQIFLNNRLEGIGLKQFRYECSKKKYYDQKFKNTERRCSTHPHQIHLELLSELGIFIYLFFIFTFVHFFKNQFKNINKNRSIYLISTTVTLLSILILPLPTGSFFSSFNASLFWFMFGLAFSFRQFKF